MKRQKVVKSVLVGALVILVCLAVVLVQRRFAQATSAAESSQEQEDIEICMSHLKQIGVALNKYRQDHNGELPLGLRALYPKYVSSEDIFFCSNDPNAEKSRDVVIPEVGRPIYSSYMYQYILGVDHGALQIRKIKIPRGRTFKELYAERGEELPIVVCVHHQTLEQQRPFQPRLWLVLRLNGKVEKVFKYVKSSEDL